MIFLSSVKIFSIPFLAEAECALIAFKSEEAIGIPVRGKNPFAVALRRLGGLKGGAARAKKLTPKQRRKIVAKAARARWQRHRKPF